MSTYLIYQVDAFTGSIFGGNSACVVPLNSWLPDNVLLSIAKENGVAETAYFVPVDEGFALRWFTPDLEIDLCGHATLATAHVLFNHLHYKGSRIVFSSQSGALAVQKEGDWLTLDFPVREAQPAVLPSEIVEGLNIQPKEVYKARDYILLYNSEEEVKMLTPVQSLIDRINLDPGGFAATAKGSEVDFVSRFFTPQAAIFEDPVTGSAHCTLAPFWAKRLGKQRLLARQLSQRQGELVCTLQGDRVLIQGQAVTYLQGSITIPNHQDTQAK